MPSRWWIPRSRDRLAFRATAFVEVGPMAVEGLVHELLNDDWYEYCSRQNRLVAAKPSFYQLGDKVQVRVIKVDVLRNQIDLAIPDALPVGLRTHPRRTHFRDARRVTMHPRSRVTELLPSPSGSSFSCCCSVDAASMLFSVVAPTRCFGPNRE